jgi:hypothetical protein
MSGFFFFKVQGGVMSEPMRWPFAGLLQMGERRGLPSQITAPPTANDLGLFKTG